MATEAKTPSAASIGLPYELVRKLRVIAAHRSVSISEFVAPLIADRVEREYRKVVNEMADKGESGA